MGMGVVLLAVHQCSHSFDQARRGVTQLLRGYFSKKQNLPLSRGKTRSSHKRQSIVLSSLLAGGKYGDGGSVVGSTSLFTCFSQTRRGVTKLFWG